jgi:hypothetical protein
MFTNFMKLIRLTVAALLIGGWSAPVAEAAPRASATQRAASSRGNDPTRDSEAGVVWIATAVALFVFMAWVAVRMNSHHRPADKVPS